MSFTITTQYSDGRIETREATPEEIANREADIKALKEYEKREKQVFQQRENDLISAKNKLKKLGFTEGEISALRNELIEL